MLIVYLILWFIFNERVTAELAVIGLLVCALVDLFSWKILGGIRRRPVKTWLKLLAGGARYAWNLLKEIFRCNAAVIRLILSPTLEVEPELHYFRTRLKTDAARVALANSITLTPGTITMEIAEQEGRIWYYVHWIEADCDGEEAGERIKGRMEKWIGRFWER